MVSANGFLTVGGNLLGTTQSPLLFSPLGTVTLDGVGTSAAPQLLEAMSADLGNVAAGYTNNFAYGTLIVGSSDYVKLVNESVNDPGSTAEAVYANNLIVPAGSTLNLNSLHLYVRNEEVAGTITGGTVTIAAPVSIAVAPVSSSLAKGLTEQFTATGTYTDNSTQNLTGLVTWASSNLGVATISASGLASALTTGTTEITATLGSVVSTSDTLTVTPPTLVSIAVASVSPSVAKGLTEQFTATGTYTDSSTQNLSSVVTWASSNLGVATISASGLASALTTGTTGITATLGSVVSTSDTVTVLAPTFENVPTAAPWRGNRHVGARWAITRRRSRSTSLPIRRGKPLRLPPISP